MPGTAEHVIKSFMAKKMKQFHALPKFGRERSPVYLLLPWLGSVSTWFEKQVKFAVKRCLFAVEPRVVYQRWSPRGRPWPRGQILKFLALASKLQVLEN